MQDGNSQGSNRRKRVTSYDVAREAGVSQSAVSRAFRPGMSVSKKTRDKIARAAKALDYRPNAIARMLITRRSSMVAVIISSLVNLNYPELLTRLTREFSERGIRVLLFTLDHPDGLAGLLESVWTFQVDGVMALTAHFDDDSIRHFEDRHIPVVLYNRQVPDRPVNAVCCDHEQGIRQLVEGLVGAGCKRFLVTTGPPFSDVANERRELALRLLEARGYKDVPVEEGDFSYESGRQCFARWMSTHDAPDAVICGNDMMAIGCIDEARENFKLRVPEQLSVVGFDGVSAGSMGSYRLTTIRQPLGQMARAAVDILLYRIEHPDAPPEKRVFAGTLIEGHSARL